MQTAIFYGASDDLIEIDGIKGADEFGIDPIAEGKKADLSQSFSIGGKLKVYAIYDGCWHFSIGQMAEGILIPDWPIRFSAHESGYSVQLEIDVPDDVSVFEVR